ncbi:MAG: oligosaccharide flippase family protein [Bacteroidales bacterium]|nr:oligosaccharide flippase family protein [Bacteroidales bacterium]
MPFQYSIFVATIQKKIQLKRKFITNLSFFLVLNLIIKPIYVFGIDRVVQNTVGAEIYGRFFTLLNIAIIFQIFLDLGIENFIRKETARHPEKSITFFSNIIVLKLILLIPYIAVCFSVALFRDFLPDEFLYLFILILLNQFLASFILFIRANLGGLQLFKTESLVSVLDRSIMIITVGSLLIYPVTQAVFKINWFIAAQTLSYSIALLTGIVLLFRQNTSRITRIDLRQFIPIIRQLLPYASLVLLMALYYRADSIFLGLLLPDGDKQAGIFAHGFRILDFLSNYALLFPILLLPIFSRIIHQKKPVAGLLQLSVLLLMIPSLCVIAPAIIYRQELFQILYTEHIQPSADAFAILTISFFGMCISYTFGALLTANGNLKQLNLMAAGAVIISVTLNLVLIPKHEVLGAAIANASAQFFTMIIHIILVVKIFRMKIHGKLLLRIGGFLTYLILASIVLSQTSLSWLTGTLLLASSGILLAFLIRLISIRGIVTVLKQEE